MINLKKIITPIGITISTIVLGQGNVSQISHYPQMYDGQASNIATALDKTALLSAKDQIDINLNKLGNDPVLKNAHWGFVIYDPKTNKVINSYNETDSFVPASTTKLLTTETAFSLLGGKFRWITQLENSGQIDADGNLNGNLYIVGSGDPSLGTRKAGALSYSEVVEEFINGIIGKGIKKINGDLVLQTAIFKENKIESLPENIVWLDFNNYYLPVGNTQDIEPKNEKILAKQNNPFSENKNFFYVSPYIKEIVYADKYEGSNTLTTKIADAPSYLGNLLSATLIKRKIPITGKVVIKTVDANPEPRAIITSYKSPTLSEIIYFTNQRSDNALAEATLRMVGFQKLGDQTLESGRTVVKDHLQKKSFDFNGFNYSDGSGLSKSNYVTPIAQVKFLASVMNDKYYKDFFDSLPIAGQSGTLKKMFFGNSYGQIFAKTGTLNKVKCLAGYIKTRSGKTLTFSLLVNNYAGSVDQVKAKMEQLLDPSMDL